MICVFVFQAPRKVFENANIHPTIWQHDRGVSFWQPYIWERSKYWCHEHAGRGLAEHQRAVLIISHLAVILSSSHDSPAEGTLHFTSSSFSPHLVYHQIVLRGWTDDNGAHHVLIEMTFCFALSWCQRSLASCLTSIVTLLMLTCCILSVCHYSTHFNTHFCFTKEGFAVLPVNLIYRNNHFNSSCRTYILRVCSYFAADSVENMYINLLLLIVFLLHQHWQTRCRY